MKHKCKECPWVVKTQNNINLIKHSKQHNRSHNCHMVNYTKSGGLWDTKKEFECVGSLENKQRL
jgi:hypothetical protein